MIDIKVKKEDMQKLAAEMKRAEKVLGKSSKDAVQLGANALCKTLSGETKRSKKMRPLVKNPLFKDHPRMVEDMRRARFGVMRYKKGHAEMVFDPIYRTGEFGKLRFMERKGVFYMNRGRGGAPNKWSKIEGIPGEALNDQIPTAMKSKKRVIGRSGLAKAAWNFARKRLRSGGTIFFMGVPNIASVKVFGGTKNPSIRITNNLRYALDALKNKEGSITSAVEKAAGSMGNRIDNELKKMGAR